MIYVAVRYSEHGKDYVYSSTVQLKRGQLVLINVYGKLAVATVVRRYKNNPLPNNTAIYPIVGVAWMLEELTAPEAPDDEPVSSGFVSSLRSLIAGE